MGKLVCTKCNKELELLNANVDYLGHHFSEKIMRCPICRQVYVSEDMVKKKINEVEITLEQK